MRVHSITEPATIAALKTAKGKGGLALDSARCVLVISGDSRISDTWIEDASIVSGWLLLQAEALGLGCCWIQIRGRANEQGCCETQVRRLLGLPDTERVLCLLALGHPAEVTHR